jgi:hypothetical protein
MINRRSDATSYANTKDIEGDYKKNLRIWLASFRRAYDGGTIKEEVLKDSMNELLAMKVPGNYKNLHLTLARAIDSMSTFLKTGDVKDKLVCQNSINKIMDENKWLE